jgi:hypothetical protein
VNKWKAGEVFGWFLMGLGAFLALILLCSCSQQDVGNLKVQRIDREVEASQFNVEYCGNFLASDADRAMYRSIYIVTDTKTGIKYLAIEGCGTAQLVSTGKTIVEQ